MLPLWQPSLQWGRFNHCLFFLLFFFPADVLIKLCLTRRKNSERWSKNPVQIQSIKQGIKKKASQRQFLQAVGQGGCSVVAGVGGIDVTNHCTRICIDNNTAHTRAEMNQKWREVCEAQVATKQNGVIWCHALAGTASNATHLSQSASSASAIRLSVRNY